MNEADLRKLNDVVAIVGGVLTVALMMRMLKPDLTTQLQLRLYRAVSRSAKRGADTLTSVAAHADTAYHRLSNVTV
jgi:hypothetical protein